MRAREKEGSLSLADSLSFIMESIQKSAFNLDQVKDKVNDKKINEKERYKKSKIKKDQRQIILAFSEMVTSENKKETTLG